MTQRYHDEITALTEWFMARLPALGGLELTKAERAEGGDSLKGPHEELWREAFYSWINDRHYELSYNQMCIAFFAAAENLGLLAIKK
jgi:hypothetical protein